MNLVDKFSIIKDLQNHQRITLTTHVNPDGDAIGSTLGLAYFLKEIGKDVRVVNISPTPKTMQFLDPDNLIEVFNIVNHKELILDTELFVVLDINESKRLVEIGELLEQREKKTIVIDHHLKPKEFANDYWIDTDAPAVGEMVWEILKEFKEDFSLISAKNIYIAIITDTGNFRFDRVDEQTHQIAADLINHGVVPDDLYDRIYNRQSQSGLNLLGEALKSIKTFYGGRLAVMSVDNEMFERTGASEDEVEGFASNPLRIEGVDAGITMTEIVERNQIRVSFRSKNGISVRELAEKFGGGGHAYAAGARVANDDFYQIQKKIIDEASMIFE